MVLFLAPAQQADAIELAYKLQPTRTLFGMLYLDTDRRGVVQRILQLDLQVVVPDQPAWSPAWQDVREALDLLQVRVSTVSQYLSTLQQPTPAPPAAPPVQQGAGVGQ